MSAIDEAIALAHTKELAALRNENREVRLGVERMRIENERLQAALADFRSRCERLGAVAEAAEHALSKFGDEYEGRLGPLREALEALAE